MAAFVLLVGVLGTLTLLETAFSVGSTTRSREAATNLGRETVEAAREIDYDLLLTNTAGTQLRALSGLADADPSAAGWQVNRRGTTFTLTVAACIYDDPKDGRFAGNTGPGYCPGLSTVPTTPADANGDDYRKITVTAAWEGRQVELISNIVNPAGGFGPRITAVASTPAISADDSTIKVNADTTIDVTVTTTHATSLNWDAGDAKHGAQLADAAGTTSWPFTWNLGSGPATYDCATTPGWTPDAPAYEMTFQPFDSDGTPGDLRTQIVSVDRTRPFAPCDFAGGRNPQHGGVVDLQWRAAFEGDVASYSVWRDKQGAEPSDRLVCDGVPAAVTECTDTSPPAGTGAIDYYVKSKQNNWKYGQDFGARANLAVPAVVTPNEPPSAPATVSLTPGVEPAIQWAASDDDDGSVIFYRIYRDGDTVAKRYAKTSNGVALTFNDKDPGGSAHTYYVSAVDNHYAESAPTQAVQVP